MDASAQHVLTELALGGGHDDLLLHSLHEQVRLRASPVVEAEKLCPQQRAGGSRAAGQLHDRAKKTRAIKADLTGAHALGPAVDVISLRKKKVDRVNLVVLTLLRGRCSPSYSSPP